MLLRYFLCFFGFFLRECYWSFLEFYFLSFKRFLSPPLPNSERKVTRTQGRQGPGPDEEGRGVECEFLVFFASIFFGTRFNVMTRATWIDPATLEWLIATCLKTYLSGFGRSISLLLGSSETIACLMPALISSRSQKVLRTSPALE